MNTEDQELQKIFELYCDYGISYSKTQKVAILSIIRNIGNRYKQNLRVAKNLLQYFHPDSFWFFYENDSYDNTAQNINSVISEHKEYSQFSIMSEQLDLPYLPLSKSQTRTYNLANARNKCYDAISDKNYDFIMVVDFDFVKLSVEGIMNSMGWIYKNESISAMCGNSFINIKQDNGSTVRHNYDSFAFRLNSWSDKFANHWFPWFRLPDGSSPIPVYSGFGGSCIYRKQFYDSLYTGETCEHVMLHRKLKEIHSDFTLFLNPSQTMLVD